MPFQALNSFKQFAYGSGAEKGGGAKWDNNGTLSVDPKHKVGNVYLRRNFGRHFGLYLGGGADMM